MAYVSTYDCENSSAGQIRRIADAPIRRPISWVDPGDDGAQDP